MSKNKKYFRLLPHGPIQQVLPNIFAVVGSMRLFGLFQYSRVMTVLNDNGKLALINPVRVDDSTLNELSKLGSIDYVFKIGQLHNVDLKFYMDQFSPELWANKGDPSISAYEQVNYFDDVNELPILNAKVKPLKGSKIKESILVTPADGGCLHSCDAFVNMGDDPMHNWLTKNLSKFLPNPTYIGPNWHKIAKPPESEMRSVNDFDFKNFIPAHGDPILGDAKEKLGEYLEGFFT